VGGKTCRRCRDGADELDVVDVVEERDCMLGGRSGYGEGDEGDSGSIHLVRW
jgi:hypothetical protein